MAIHYESIAPTFAELRSFLLDDLRILLAPGRGGNYASVLLITTACEAIGRLRFGDSSGGERFFAEYLLPEGWRTVGVDLYNALRNGLAHAYETKRLLQLGDCPIEIGVSRVARPHLSFEQAESLLCVNVEKLAVALEQALERYEAELRTSPKLRDTFVRWIKREVSVEIQDSNRRKAWRQILGLPESERSV